MVTLVYPRCVLVERKETIAFAQGTEHARGRVAHVTKAMRGPCVNTKHNTVKKVMYQRMVSASVSSASPALVKFAPVVGRVSRTTVFATRVSLS